MGSASKGQQINLPQPHFCTCPKAVTPAATHLALANDHALGREDLVLLGVGEWELHSATQSE